jgi:hypothetical protein
MDPWLIARADYYEELTISSSASIRVIQAAYRVSWRRTITLTAGASRTPSG